MKLKIGLIIGGVAVMGALTFGGMQALGSKSSDVGSPVPTPDSHTVRYHVVGTSMDPTINDGDWLLARTDMRTLNRGDIIIMRYPKDETKIYCRRVVAISGDRVVMKYYSNAKITTVYSHEHPEGVVFPQNAVGSGNDYGEYTATVGNGELYVVGDNTAPGGSYDSDEWGLLPVGNVAGLVTKRVDPSPRNF